MDLYEELVTEEQHSRESSYTEVSRRRPPYYLYYRAEGRMSEGTVEEL